MAHAVAISTNEAEKRTPNPFDHTSHKLFVAIAVEAAMVNLLLPHVFFFRDELSKVAQMQVVFFI